MPRNDNPKLRELVACELQGAELRNWYVTGEDGGKLEQVFVVLWKRGEEYGTHRAVINYELDEAALMWGHYFSGPNAVVGAYKDFARRIVDGV